MYISPLYHLMCHILEYLVANEIEKNMKIQAADYIMKYVDDIYQMLRFDYIKIYHAIMQCNKEKLPKEIVDTIMSYLIYENLYDIFDHEPETEFEHGEHDHMITSCTTPSLIV
eukprot:233645_1